MRLRVTCAQQDKSARPTSGVLKGGKRSWPLRESIRVRGRSLPSRKLQQQHRCNDGWWFDPPRRWPYFCILLPMFSKPRAAFDNANGRWRATFSARALSTRNLIQIPFGGIHTKVPVLNFASRGYLTTFTLFSCPAKVAKWSVVYCGRCIALDNK